VNLNYSLITDESMQNFSNSLKRNKTLKSLHMNGCNLTSESANILSHGLQNNSTIEKLEFSYNNHLTLEAVESLIKPNINIHTLFFCDNQLKAEGGKIIGEFLKYNTSLKHLYIEKNELCDEGVCDLSNGLRFNRQLEVLNLSENKITHLGLRPLVESLNHLENSSERNFINTSLKKLFLRGNIFNNSDAANLLGELIYTNRAIEILDLSNNNLFESLIKPVSEALKYNNVLTTLILESNQMGGLGCSILSENLKYNTALTTLNLRNNSLGFEGAKSIGELLSLNHTLVNLNLQTNLLDEHSISFIVEKLNTISQSNIESINIAYNQLNNIHEHLQNVNFAKDVLIY